MVEISQSFSAYPLRTWSNENNYKERKLRPVLLGLPGNIYDHMQVVG